MTIARSPAVRGMLFAAAALAAWPALAAAAITAVPPAANRIAPTLKSAPAALLLPTLEAVGWPGDEGSRLSGRVANAAVFVFPATPPLPSRASTRTL